MSKVHNPTSPAVLPIEALYHIINRLCNRSPRAIQNTRIGVTLNDNRPLTNSLHGLSRVMQPVKSNNIVAHVACGIKGVPCALWEDHHRDTFQPHLSESLGKVLGDVLEVRLGELLK